MGMFDSVRVVHIDNQEFEDNGTMFQTKDLDCDLDTYYVFNNRLWMLSESQDTLNEMEQVPYDGTLNIYERVVTDAYEQWIEYNLSFENGHLVGVENVSSGKELKDVSERRPNLPNAVAVVKIDLSNRTDEDNKPFYDSLSDNLDKIRDIVGDKKATVFYTIEPAQASEDKGIFAMARGARYSGMVASVVQDFSGLELNAGSRSKTIDTPNGDKIKVFVDELNT